MEMFGVQTQTLAYTWSTFVYLVVTEFQQFEPNRLQKVNVEPTFAHLLFENVCSVKCA